MKVNYNTSNLNTTLQSSNSNPNTQTYARVLDVILDDTHPSFSEKGRARSINGIFYRPLDTRQSESNVTTHAFAYQSSTHFKTVPIPGEIVEIITGPSPEPVSDSKKSNTKYYRRLLGVWNHPNSNVSLNTYGDIDTDPTQKGAFKQVDYVNPTRSAPGDIQIEGRFGQSIRLTGAKGSANPFIDDSNIGKPAMLIAIGKGAQETGFQTSLEDINADKTSIYVTTDHKIPLEQASSKRKSYTEVPKKVSEFRGNQLLINSGRIVLNTKSDDIQLLSTKSIGLSSKTTVNIDSEDFVCLDAPKIFLGEKARSAGNTEKEPLLLGNQTEAFLETLLNILESAANDMIGAVTVKGDAIPLINKRGAQMKIALKLLKGRINPNGPSTLKSTKTYTQ